jgi:predicted nucleic acid-binding protein
MNDKVFVDSDVILDLLLDRGTFYNPAASVFKLGLTRNIELYTTAVVLSNVFYFSRKKHGPEKAKGHIRDICRISNILPISKEIVINALNSNFTDFEDALQYFSVRQTDVSVILTRNLRDYKVDDIAIQTPEGYVNQLLADI